MTRKLATIQRITELLPIKGADRIEIAVILGWQVVTQKGQHTAGDLVVFYEIDSFLPASDPRYASFSERFINWGGKEGMRLKTIKLKKELSQGLIMPVREFPELANHFSIKLKGGELNIHARFQAELTEGEDVTDILKIEKWEMAEKANTSQPGTQGTKTFPVFIRKTDQERIQNYGQMAERALDEYFEVTVKKDGSSMTVFRVNPSSEHYAAAVALTRGKLGLWARLNNWVDNLVHGKQPVYGICSRNVLLPLEGITNFHTAAAPVLAALRKMPDHLYNGSIAVQGEVVAPSIQDNYEKVDGVEFHMFDIFNIDKQAYELPMERNIWAKNHGVNHATIVKVGTLREILGVTDDATVVAKALAYASGPGDNPGVMREGVVFKACGRDMSFKAVSNEYLLATGK